MGAIVASTIRGMDRVVARCLPLFRPLSLLLFSSVIACGGELSGDTERGSLDAATPPPPASCPADDGDASTCPVACCVHRDGGAEGLATVSQTISVLTGRWLLCGDRLPNAPPDVIGVEFDPNPMWDGGDVAEDGAVRYLVTGPSGPRPGQGFSYEGTWSVFSPYSLTINYLGTPFSYWTCPEELELEIAHTNVLFVRSS